MVRRAMALFKRENVDMICHLGDLANEYAPEGFKEYRRTIEDAFGGAVPKTLYAFGGHDRNQYKLQPGEKNREEAVWAIMRKTFKAEHDLCDIVEFRGYAFVVLQEYASLRTMEDLVAKAVAAHPGQPVFVLMHEPAYNTCEKSVAWGSKKLLGVLEKYSNVIHLSGHSHDTNRNEREIWQGEFTEVNLGCLTGWLADAGNADFDLLSHYDDGVMTMDVFPNSVVFHRFAVTTGEEVRPDRPWTVPLPHDPKTAPLRWEARKAASKPPYWTKDAKCGVKWVAEPKFCGLSVEIPEARHADDPYMYVAEVFGTDGRRIAYKEIFGEFWKMPVSERSGKVVFDFDEALFAHGEKCRVSVRAFDFFGNAGVPLTVEAGEPSSLPNRDVVWKSARPMEELVFSTHNWGRDRKPLAVGADGWVAPPVDMMSADLPPAAIPASDPSGTEYRLIYTLEDRHESPLGNWILGVENAATGKAISGSRNRARLLTPRGNVGPVAYVFYFKKTEAGSLPVRISFMYGGGNGRVAISDARIERVRR